MCGQFYIADEDRQEFLAIMADVMNKAKSLRVDALTCGNARPTDITAVLATSARNRSIGAFPMRWGYRHPEKCFLIINTRSETAETHALFRESAKNRRCLIPASGYYEWKNENGKKTRYSFCSVSGEPLYLAGLYIWQQTQRLPCYSILTREAEGSVADIHGRMPVILPREAAELWLSPNGESHGDISIGEILRSFSCPAIKATVDEPAAS